MNGIFPIVMSEEARLLTAIVLGGLFGFSLERAGFGNARKLVGQFYLHDMTVFKVMFTAIIVAMAGLFTLTQLGYVELSMVWINPTFIWSQVIGGFLLGVGFVISGLCPGTSVVSAASGRIDAVVAFAGIFFGTLVFTLLVDWLPALDRLYHAGSMGTSLLPDVLHLPAPLLALAVVLMALGGFIGAEIVERRFSAAHADRVVELTPATRPRMKLAVTFAVGLVAMLGIGALQREQPTERPIAMASIDPLAVARRIIARDPNLLILDVRGGKPEKTLPGAAVAAADTSAVALLAAAVPARTTVVVYDESGALREVPRGWPRDLKYEYITDGFRGWQQAVLAPASPTSSDAATLEQVREQNQIAAYFSGAAAPAAPVAAPAPSAGGAVKKKKAGGC